MYLDKDLKGSGHKKVNDDSFTEEDLDENRKGFMQDKELYNNNGESSELHFSNGGNIPNLKSTLRRKGKGKDKDEMVMNIDK